MSLIRRNAVPLFILIAVIAVGTGVFTSTSPFAFGQEQASCVPVAGGSLSAIDEEGNPVTVVSNGDVVIYGATLGIPETLPGQTACNFEGGTLTIILPNDDKVIVAGTEETGPVPMVQRGSPFAAQTVRYTVSQEDADNGNLTAEAIYADGQSLSSEGDVVGATLTSGLRMTPPSIAIEKITTTPIIFFGQTAGFNITVVNTGGYMLTNVTISDTQVESCDGLNFGTLVVGEEKSGTCSALLDSDITNEAHATASVPGGPPAGMETVTSEPDTASVSVEGLDIGIIVDTTTPHVRVGNQGEVSITVIMPPQTSVDDVIVTVPEAPQCDASWDVLPASAEETYTCMVETDPETEGSLSLGTTAIVGTVTGSVPDVPLSAEDSTDVSVFSLALNITIDPEEQTIREGYTATFTVNVSNQADDVLSNVMVTNETVSDCAATFESLAPGEVQTYECSQEGVMEDMETTVYVVATAADGNPVDASDSASIIILRPSTAVGVSAQTNTILLQLVVHTLKITETNDGDSPLTNICVEFDPTGSILPHQAMDAMNGESMEGEGMEGEGMAEGEAMAVSADPCSEPTPGVMVLNRDSVEYVGGDVGDDGVMDVGETWEWRVVSVGIEGNYVALGDGASNMNFVAVGHGTDILGGDVTYPGDVEELAQIQVPIVSR